MRLGTPPSVRRTHDGAALFALDASVSRAARLTAGMDDQQSCRTTTSARSQPLPEASVSRSSVDALGTRLYE